MLAMIVPCFVIGITRTVKLDGSGDYTIIQNALDASVSGDTVLVYPGRYFENLVIQTNNITLLSLEAISGNQTYIDSTIIDGNHLDRCLRITQNKQNIIIRGFTLINGFSIGGGGGIALAVNTSSSLSNLKICNNTALLGGGINIGASTVCLSGVDIYDNYALQFGGGVFADAGAGYTNNITFDPDNRCSIYNNRSGAGQDIFIQNATSDLIVYLDTFSVAVFKSYYAIFLTQNEADYQLHIDIQNTHHQEIDQDVYVSPDGSDSNNGLSPQSPLKTIHEGIYRVASDSLSQKTVHLLPGTYSRTTNNQIYPIALKSWVKVQGSGIDSTEVIGEPHPLIPVGYGSADFVFMTCIEPVVSIADMTITTSITNNSCVLHGSKKGSLNLTNIRIHNVTPDYFSAIWAYLSNEYDSKWDNVIIENIVTPDMGLVDINGSFSGKISNSVFRNATSTYTSASVWAYPLVSFRGDKNLTFENCEFSNLTMTDDNSTAIGIGGVQFPQQSNNFSFSNCLFSNNTSPGGIIATSSTNQPIMSFNNCTFAGNLSDTYTLVTNGNVNIVNTIFDNDTPYQIKVNPMNGLGELTTLNIDYSNIKDGIAGIQQAVGNTINYLATNIDSDPLFSGGDDINNPLYYRLSAASPCINAGTPDTLGLFLPPYDLAENWRIWNTRIDMGCFEYGSEPWVGNDDPVVPAIPALSITAYPNPFSVYTNIRVSSLKSGGDRPERVNDASITIYNIKGQRVKSIMLDPEKTGEQLTHWDGRDMDNIRCSSGIYFVNLIVNGRNVSTRKVSLIR